ncbi:MAG: hypothetical protein K5675_08600 [Lachnospiraceae bacterium]|nr:hypothetical protein [Lachnospiraceae bacterium]
MFQKKRYYIYWIIVGIYLSITAAAMMITPYGSLEQFYNDGYREEYAPAIAEVAFAQGVYSEDGIYSYTASENPVVTMYTMKVSEETPVNYLFANMEVLSGEEVPVHIQYVKDGAILTEQEIGLSSGANYYKLLDMEVDSYNVYFQGSKDFRFALSELALSEYSQRSSEKDLLLPFAIVLCIYFAISTIIIRTFGKKVRIETSVYHLSNAVETYFPVFHVDEKYRRILRSGLFIALYIMWRCINVLSVAKYYNHAMIGTILVFLALIGLMPRDKKWKNRKPMLMEVLIILLFVVEFVSDIFVSKVGGYTEIWMGFAFAAFGYFWLRMEHPKELLIDFLRAMTILMIIDVVYAIYEAGTYPELKYYRVSGFWDNPNPFAVSLATYIGCGILYMYLEKLPLWKKLLVGAVSIAAAYLVYVSQCRTALLMVVAIAILMIGFIFYFRLSPENRRKLLLLVIPAGVVFVGVFLLILQGFSGRTVNELDATSGRLEIWTNYMKHMNLFGHEFLCSWRGNATYSHNFLVREHFKYGILAGMMFVIILIEFLYQILVMFKKGKEKTLIAVIIGFFCYGFGALLDSGADFPMFWVNWYMFYMMIVYFVVLKYSGKKYGK